MSTYQRCDPSVKQMADCLLVEFDTHQPLLDAKVRIDFLFAYPSTNDDGKPTGPALSKNGMPALGICRKVSLKDRAKGLGDAEICLDAEHWNAIEEPEKRALLDHELHHIKVVEGKTDDLGRPVLKMRKHDVEVGWFDVIANRHGAASIERRQASEIMEMRSQYYFPSIVNATGGRMSKIDLQANTVTLRTASGKEVTAPRTSSPESNSNLKNL